jgi:hypothetical protein
MASAGSPSIAVAHAAATPSMSPGEMTFSAKLQVRINRQEFLAPFTVIFKPDGQLFWTVHWISRHNNLAHMNSLLRNIEIAVFYNLLGRHGLKTVLSLWRRDPVHNRFLQPINHNLFHNTSSQEPNYNFDDLNHPGNDDRMKRVFHFNQLEVNQVVNLYADQRICNLHHNQAGYLVLSRWPPEPEIQNAAIQPAAPTPTPAPTPAPAPAIVYAEYDISSLLADANLKEDPTADATADATVDTTKRDPLRAWRCGICLDGIQEDRMLVAAHDEYVVPGNRPDAGQHHFHVFHRNCLAEWVASNVGNPLETGAGAVS